MMNNETTRGYSRGMLVLVVAIGAFLTMLNQTILSVAQPAMMKSLNVDATTVQWLSTGYSLVNGILIPVSAWLANRFNTKWLYEVALVFFLAGTLVSFIAGGFAWLLVGRLVQAIGAGVLSGLAMMILFSVYPRENRSIPTAVMGAVFGIAPVIGPTIGGWIVDASGWRNIFGLMMPLLVIELLLGLFFLADVIPHSKAKLDWPSIALSTAGFGALLYDFSNVGNDGWLTATTIWPIIGGALVVLGFLYRQSQLDAPVLDLRVYKTGDFSVASVLGAIAQISMVAVEFILPLYLQNLRGLSAIQSGLTLLPGAVAMALMSPVAGRMIDRHLGKQLVIAGTILMTVATFSLTMITLSTSIALIVTIYAVRNIGLAMVMMPASTLGMNALPKNMISHGSANNNMVRQVGAAIGTALLISLMQNVATNNAPSNGLLKTNAPEFAHQMNLAFLSGAHAALLAASAISALGVLLALFLHRDKQVEPTAEPELEKG